MTHEQADFDAVASLLAAHLFNEKAHPILPNKLNNNVRSFLNLYKDELPFLEARDLQSEPIKKVTLVDTQSLVTLKGVNSETTIEVIDHHPIRKDLPEGWTCQFKRVGATTSILIDQIRDNNIPLSVVQATLLLLGIYEDTGSLTYATTDPIDAYSSAFLLQQGADLQIVVKFLNPPLSENQKKLADILLKNTQSLLINGKNVIISQAEYPQMNEEISSIAHKLRDLLDPDGLFLFVRTNEGIRFIARSTNDEVNVAQIAQDYGGGGHDRAAAALIHPDNAQDDQSPALNEYCEELAKRLQEIIKPSLQVAKIMSPKPHLLPADTSAQDAGKLMQHYGFEGFPVIENDRVIGLLTRRAVDRAIQHKVNMNAANLMEAGNYSIKKTDSVEKLQELMAQTGWGQIPVVDETDGNIIGIVTRTDLLKALVTKKPNQPQLENLASMLEKNLPQQRFGLLKQIAAFASEAHLGLYIVGGFVRDLLLDRPSPDLDMVVEGDAETFARSLMKRFGGKVIQHRRFGTAKWQINKIKPTMLKEMGLESGSENDLPDSLDFISARTEFYERPTALPTVERSSIKLDLYRRDFTINTLALRLDGKYFGDLYDHWGGLSDLRDKQICVMHSLSFVDDPTRLLRAVRFEQRFGFSIETRTFQLMEQAADLLHQLSGERIKHELDVIFLENDPTSILSRLEELHLLQEIAPGLHWDKSMLHPMNEVLQHYSQEEWSLPDTMGNTPARVVLAYLVWLTLCGREPAIAVSQRLHLPNLLKDTLIDLINAYESRDQLKEYSPGQFTFQLEKISAFGLFALHCLVGDEKLKEDLLLLVTKWNRLHPQTDGNRLKERGIPPGPIYARIIERLREDWLNGEITKPEEEQEFLEKILKDLNAQN